MLSFLSLFQKITDLPKLSTKQIDFRELRLSKFQISQR